MSILFCRVFGIGNAVMSTAAIKHYRDHSGQDVDVMVGTAPDDYGSLQVLRRIPGVRVLTDQQTIGSPGLSRWELGVASMPYDGRWNGWLEKWCGRVVDGRTRPDPSTFGFSSWKKHEAIYQLELAEEITGVPRMWPPYSCDCSFWDEPLDDDGSVYLGIGRKYDAAGFWERKHWGDENFTQLVVRILREHPDRRVNCTGGVKDLMGTGRYIIQRLNSEHPDIAARFKFHIGHIASGDPLDNSFRILSRCGSYVGNDTGMMHVAASMGKPTVAVFNFEGTLEKNHPMYPPFVVLEGHQTPVTVDQVYDAWRELVHA